MRSPYACRSRSPPCLPGTRALPSSTRGTSRAAPSLDDGDRREHAPLVGPQACVHHAYDPAGVDAYHVVVYDEVVWAQHHVDSTHDDTLRRHPRSTSIEEKTYTFDPLSSHDLPSQPRTTMPIVQSPLH